jgi:hypothetical protein
MSIARSVESVWVIGHHPLSHGTETGWLALFGGPDFHA